MRKRLSAVIVRKQKQQPPQEKLEAPESESEEEEEEEELYSPSLSDEEEEEEEEEESDEEEEEKKEITIDHILALADKIDAMKSKHPENKKQIEKMQQQYDTLFDKYNDLNEPEEPEEQIPIKPKAGEPPQPKAEESPQPKAEFLSTYQTYEQLQKLKSQPSYKTASPENKLEIQLRLKREINKKIERGETVTKKVKTGNSATIEALTKEIESKKPSAGKGLKHKPIKHVKEEIKQIEIKPIFNHDRFEILKGEIIAGNDSKDILKEFKKMLHDAVRKRLITHEELEEYLEEIDVN
jgi:hypothetical protein